MGGRSGQKAVAPACRFPEARRPGGNAGGALLGPCQTSGVADLELILASGSPRRRELLRRVGVHPRVEPAAVDETPLSSESAGDYVERLAQAKAMAALSPTRVVLAADTTVALDGVILGKPADRDEARAMLRSLAARSHQVLTGIAVAVVGTDGDAVVHSALDVTEVVVGEITEERLAWYIDSGDADDKAGAYGLQGAAGLFADRIEGSANGVIGLSLALVDRLFAAHGLDLLDFRSPAPIDPVETIAARALRHVTRPPGRDEPVVQWAGPADLAADFARTIGLEITDDEPPAKPGDLVDAANLVVRRSVQTNHPYFLNQNYAGADPLAVVGDWLGAALNTTNATFEVAPVFTMIERALLAKMARLVGFPESGDHPAGLMCAGASLAQLHALQLARHRLQPDLVTAGSDGRRLRILVSDSGHYAAEKIAAVMGLGRASVVSVPTDAAGVMDVDALDECLSDEPEVLAVIATAGTTVTAAFDPIDAIADRCEEHGIWLHVDAAYGGAALLSPMERHRLSGIERADSVVWNLHKMAGLTQQCTALLVREPERLLTTFATGADYLFQPDKANADLDAGDRSLQCGRRVDALKAWLTWKSRGDVGMAARIDHAVALADHARRRVAERDDVAFIVAGDFTNVCLTWVPPGLRPFDLTSLDDAQHAALHTVAPAAKAAMQEEGSALIGYQPVHGINCFRLIFMNPAVTLDDVEILLELITRHSEAAWRSSISSEPLREPTPLA
ncbi:MAG: septum formation protein Maf [Acidimicrobiaceae bacterium]|nr:septum formation protein Maf [Acidimicrobiaceae bacterium]